MITLFLKNLSTALDSNVSFKRLLNSVKKDTFPVTVEGVEQSFLPALSWNLNKLINRIHVIVVPTEIEAEALQKDFLLFGIKAEILPWWEAIPYKPVQENSQIFGERVHVLSTLIDKKTSVYIVSLRSFLTPLPPPEYVHNNIVSIAIGDSFDPTALEERLSRYGYTRVPRVSLRGEFALRGEVLDVFLPGQENAIRIVFEYSEVESIRIFDPATQASVENLHSVSLYPVKEVVWDAERISQLEKNCRSISELKNDFEDAITRLEMFGEFEGEELYYPLSFEKPASVIDYAPKGSLFFFYDYERLSNSYHSLEKEYGGLYRKALSEKKVPKPDRILLNFNDELEKYRSRILFPRLDTSEEGDKDTVRFICDPPHSFFGNIEFFKEELKNRISSGYEVFVFADSEAQTKRIAHLLKEFRVTILPESISGGFSLPEDKILVIQENEIFGRRKRIPKSVKQVQSQAIDTFVELNPEDYIVHVNYGIGRFKGIKRLSAGGNERDYIHIEYAGNEFIYIPIEQVNLIQRYIGFKGDSPRLDKIGGKAWENRKYRVKKNVEDLAERLIRLYSKRKKVRGFAFPSDTDWQVEFEAQFPNEETQDQIICINEVKQDMESPDPMDRLICGDVGYGKTEIALRAAFKAIMGGKQVAFLAPTTILAEQHFETVIERMDRYPIEATMLSRFISRGDQKKVLKKLKEGDVDIVVGTHRLLQRDVKFKDLGLIVVDEEQRFGVKDKERLKELKTNVDCLTLTATPIPRTLHMSLLKIRDMSLLNTPPHNRRPIQTHIGEFDEEQIAQAVLREISRDGQVYYLHNRVETLENVLMFLRRIVPEALIESAHGKMSGQELEDKMHRFIHRGFQVLVATTIIENGIDIPNVNTIIIDRADMYGISQLYQLRGRVGRSERLAYAYLFYPEKQVLSELAMKRLRIISDYTELGSGFKIALKDLEVRGAGNLLGREQSGDILSVGFDLYLRLLDAAIESLSEEPAGLENDAYLELEYSGYIPDSYISETMEKMAIYKRIASISNPEELDAVITELTDRYGPMPDEVHSLLSIAELRILCKRLSIVSMKERKGKLAIEFGKVSVISPERVIRLIEESGGTVSLDPKRPNVLIIHTGNIGLKEKSEFILGRISQLL